MPRDEFPLGSLNWQTVVALNMLSITCRLCFRFAINPELTCAMMFCQDMTDLEAIVLTGAEVRL